MSLVKRMGGTSIAVYPPKSTKRQKEAKLSLADTGRVNYIAPADYTEGARLEFLVRALLEKIAADVKLLQF